MSQLAIPPKSSIGADAPLQTNLILDIIYTTTIRKYGSEQKRLIAIWMS